MRFVWTVLSAVVLILLAAEDGVNAAPEPCFELLNSHHYHYHETSTEAPTTKPPREKDSTREVRRNRMKRIEKLVQEWLMPWTVTTPSSGESQSKFMDSFTASYYDLITLLFNMFSY